MPSEIEAQDVVVVKAATAKDRVFDPLAVKYVVLAFPMLLFYYSVRLRSGRLLHPLKSPGRITGRSRMAGSDSRSDHAAFIACKQALALRQTVHVEAG
jgi:hypothetical protein